MPLKPDTPEPVENPAARFLPLLSGFTCLALVAILCWLLLQGGPAAVVHHDLPPPPTIEFSLDINTAGPAELAVLPGIGPTIATRLIEYRRLNGPFPSLEAITAVPGIGPATLTRMRPYLRPIPGSGPD